MILLQYTPRALFCLLTPLHGLLPAEFASLEEMTVGLAVGGFRATDLKGLEGLGFVDSLQKKALNKKTT